MKKTFILLFFSIALLSYSAAFAVEVAPRISDKEIIEKLSALDAKIDKETAEIRGDIKKLEADIKNLDEGQKNILREIDKRFEAADKRFDDMNSRFDDLRWMFGIFISISLIILGFVLRMQWQMHKKQTQVETTLETQKDELAFLKTLIEKLLPPKGAL